MEILHFCPSKSFSGLEQYAVQMAADQKKKGRKIGFVVIPGSKLEGACREAGIEVVPFDPYESMFATPKFWAKLQKLVHQEKDLRVFHLHSTQELLHIYGAVFFKRFRGTSPKTILQSHIWINHRKKDLFHKLLYSSVDEIWCSSEPQKKSLLENLPVSEEKMRIVNYGRDIEQIEKGFLSRDDARRALEIPANAVVIGCVSRFEESKGIREFTEASVSLLKNHLEAHLVIIGGASPGNAEASRYTENLHRWVNAQGPDLQARIHFPGMVPDSNKYLKAFDLYVLPSYQECFSLALLDAQLAGLPVVGSESGGTPEVVCEGKTGWLFKPKDVAHLRQKLEEAYGNKTSWNQFGERAKDRVKSEFNQKDICDLILKYYALKNLS